MLGVLVPVVFVALDLGFVVAGLAYLHARRAEADPLDLRNRHPLR